jgi:K+-sensing histidine kinase KdpD
MVHASGENDDGSGNPSAEPVRSPRLTLIASIVILIIFFWLDYLTGYEFGFFIFYFIPVSLAAWFVGRRAGLALAIASAVAWFLADDLAPRHYSKGYFIYWETFMRLASFLTTALTIAKIRESMTNERRLNAELRRLLEENRRMRCALGERAPGDQG